MIQLAVGVRQTGYAPPLDAQIARAVQLGRRGLALRKHNVATVLVTVGAVFGCSIIACSSDSSSDGASIPDAAVPDTGTITVPTNEAGADSSVPLSITLSPPNGNLLTCTGKVTATVPNPPQATNVVVTIPSTPAGIGALSTTSSTPEWDAPKSVPTNASFTLTGTVTLPDVNNQSATTSGQYTLATAFPGVASVVTGSTGNEGESFGIYPHWSAASANRVYTVWPDKPGGNTTGKIMLQRSDDGGATWLATPVTALSATFTDGANSSILCASVTIDAGNPDVVYVLAEFTNSNSYATSVGGDGDALVLGVSIDGGKTFTPRVMQVGGSANGPDNIQQVGLCGDMISPAANTIVVESPTNESAFDTPDLAIWFDTNKGAGFAGGITDGSDYIASGFQDSLQNVNKAADENHRLDIGQDGGGDETGAATESPRLATDGKGNICLTFIATQAGVTPNTENAFIMCSADNGKTFGSLITLNPADSANLHHAQAIAAMGPNGKIAVVWTDGLDAGMGMKIATSTNGGTSFGAPVAIPLFAAPGVQGPTPALTPSLAYDADGILWLAYAPYDGDVNDRIVVDKSCDDGATWSGAVLVNGPEGHIPKLQWPSLAMTTGTPHIFVMAENHMTGFSLSP